MILDPLRLAPFDPERWEPKPTNMAHLHEEGSLLPGDCWRCCIAAVTHDERDDVPHFLRYSGIPGQGQGDTDPEGLWWWATLGWLGSCGLWLRTSFVPEVGAEGAPVREALDAIALPGPFLLSGKSPRGACSHAVVAYRGEVVWDPHPSRAGLESASAWTEFLVVQS